MHNVYHGSAARTLCAEPACLKLLAVALLELFPAATGTGIVSADLCDLALALCDAAVASCAVDEVLFFDLPAGGASLPAGRFHVLLLFGRDGLK